MDPVVITALDQEGRGIARVDGKAIFVEGALIGERVAIEVFQRKPNYEKARAIEILTASAARAVPRCPHFGVCGGCSLQHAEASAQVAAKQRVLEDAFWHIGRIRPQQMLAPIHGPTWEYRQRARLSVRDVPKKGGVLVGFHERKSSYVTDMTSCAVLPARISALAPRIAGARRQAVVARPDSADRARVRRERRRAGRRACLFASWNPRQPLTNANSWHSRIVITFMSGCSRADRRLSGRCIPPQCRLAYALPDFGVTFAFDPTDFTQVNAAVNRVLVRRAMGLLGPAPGERIARFLLRSRQFHPADRAARRHRGGHRRQCRADSPSGGQCGGQRPRRQYVVCHARICSRRPQTACARSADWTRR